MAADEDRERRAKMALEDAVSDLVEMGWDIDDIDEVVEAAYENAG